MWKVCEKNKAKFESILIETFWFLTLWNWCQKLIQIIPNVINWATTNVSPIWCNVHRTFSCYLLPVLIPNVYKAMKVINFKAPSLLYLSLCLLLFFWERNVICLLGLSKKVFISKNDSLYYDIFVSIWNMGLSQRLPGSWPVHNFVQFM